MAKLMKLSNVEVISHLMFPRVKQLVEAQLHLLELMLPKQIWEHLGSLLNQQQPKVRPGQQLKNLGVHLHLVRKLEALLLVRSPHNPLLQLKKLEDRLQRLQLRGKEEIKLYKNNLRIIKFLAQVQLAVKRALPFNNRNLPKLVHQNCQDQVPPLRELGRLSQQFKNLLQKLTFNPRKVFQPKKHQEASVNFIWLMRLQAILPEASIVLRQMIIHQRVRI